MHAELKLGYGIRVGHNAVAMLMSRAGLRGLSGNRDGDPLRPGHPSPPGHSPTGRSNPVSCPPSVSVGDCFDNALMESFWARVQVELLDRRRRRTRIELGQRYLIPRNLPQPATTPHRPRHANTDRMRENPPRQQPNRRPTGPSELTPKNPVTISPKKRGNSRRKGDQQQYLKPRRTAEWRLHPSTGHFRGRAAP